jgi:small subunit ribosomal protein S8
MSISDPIADMLTIIRNGQTAGHKYVDNPGAKLKREVARVLLEQKFVRDVRWIDDDKQGVLRVYLKYTPEEKPVILGIKRVSMPGRRVYCKKTNLPRVMGGLGIAILSTPQGVKTDRECRREGLGGEVLCHVW